ncbi:hypothetical protein CMI47_11090 [Candidatus Pacearchaeota archaeon]|nr:hypothetical protein [Candidatus Pacearchaeota archaeon]|tara:strand:+ start:3289 stop:3723 length:435 start_codon:yes stop_codon:yes gene_type:complete
MNPKALGEKGEKITIGELAKLDIEVAIPLSDNLPWDLILVWGSGLHKIQVKSSKLTTAGCSNSITFDLTSNNWYKKTTKKYTAKEVDAIVLCDYQHIYILGPKDFAGRRTFTIRYEASKNKQSKGCNFASDYLVTEERLSKLWP